MPRQQEKYNPMIPRSPEGSREVISVKDAVGAGLMSEREAMEMVEAEDMASKIGRWDTVLKIPGYIYSNELYDYSTKRLPYDPMGLDPVFRKKVEYLQQYAPGVLNSAFIGNPQLQSRYPGYTLTGIVPGEGFRSTQLQYIYNQTGKSGASPSWGKHNNKGWGTAEAIDVDVELTGPDGTKKQVEVPIELLPTIRDVLPRFGITLLPDTQQGKTSYDYHHWENSPAIPVDTVANEWDPIREFNSFDEAMAFAGGRQGMHTIRGNYPFLVYRDNTDPAIVREYMKKVRDRDDAFIAKSVIQAVGPPINWRPREDVIAGKYGLYDAEDKKVGVFPSVEAATTYARGINTPRKQYAIKEEAEAVPGPPAEGKRAFRAGKHKETGRPVYLEYPMTPAGEEWLHNEMFKRPDVFWNEDSDEL